MITFKIYEQTLNFILELTKIVLPPIIALIPFIYNVCTEEKRNLKNKKEMKIETLYNNLQTYYNCSMNLSFAQKNVSEKEKIEELIYNNRINFKTSLNKAKKYFKKNELKKINELVDLILNIDMNTLCELKGKDFLYDNAYENISKTYNEVIDILNVYL